jgi:hypothetical protein
MSTDHDEMPARYRPDDLGTTRYSATDRIFKTPRAVIDHLGLQAGDVVSMLPRDASALTLRPGLRTGAVATHEVYDGKPERRRPQPTIAGAGRAVDYLGLEAGDRVRWEYPDPHDADRVILRVVGGVES